MVDATLRIAPDRPRSNFELAGAPGGVAMGGSQIIVRGIVVVGIAVSTATVGGCTHWWGDDRRAYGSLKDNVVATPATKVATPSRRTTTGSIDARPAAAVVTARPVEAPIPPPLTATTTPAPPSPPATSPIETANIDRAKPTPEAVDSVQAANDRARLEARIISLQLLEEGVRLVSMGRVIEGRTRLFAAMEGANPEVLLALARSFDTFYLDKIATSDGSPDPVRALALYQRAVERGSIQAAEDLARLTASWPAR